MKMCLLSLYHDIGTGSVSHENVTPNPSQCYASYRSSSWIRASFRISVICSSKYSLVA